MSPYAAPLRDMNFVVNELAGLGDARPCCSRK